MKANEAPKSKFVYPDKLYARTKDNITIDISYAPQTLEAVEYVRTDAFIEKAVSYLEGTLFNEVCYGEIRPDIVQAYIDDFKQAMKDE